MYMHRPTGQPFISFSLPDSTTTNFVGHLLVPVPAVGIHIEHQVAAAVGKCALPAELQAVLAQATRRHYVDRVRRPVEVLSAVSGEGVYFVVSREQASVRAAELVGRVIDGQGWRPTGVHVPPIVQVTVGEDGPWKRALIVVVRKKVLEWLLLGLGYAKPGEEAHACVADPLVVWY
ncbi:hypothetical protein BCR44DRAFT_35167 [Catenaria anguillulae PL171]|uniref:Uncharacterized protein n=1 Tax=Catenaria anguillulae PL171 TaxID=765915 RepID=A0A1Y2H824_9FUNG|nr:hypothetical protein BCR44DRAFT_35167 [Catenaria anguillulae PL171]